MSIIKIENLSKKYIIGHDKAASGMYRYGSLRDSIAHTCRGISQRLLHPLSPNLETTSLEEFWALKDINLEIQQGDKVGIIGRNGAGKSTLLKILSRITEPTTGKFTIKGRVASLLEVGTGFHPELSGRENIYLNGAVLGMTRKEIKKKFDEIVDFSGVEKFLDTPVKRYSSGMYVRLAFAVAAHLEPEILLIDEVLAVGDAEFQKKCLGKMDDVSKQGRTILFVSHNMGVIESLCNRAIFLSNGNSYSYQDTISAIERYFDNGDKVAERNYKLERKLPGDNRVKLLTLRTTNKSGEPVNSVDVTESINIEMEYRVLVDGLQPLAHYLVKDIRNKVIFTVELIPEIKDSIDSFRLSPGDYRFTCTIPGNFLNNSTYYIDVFSRKYGDINDVYYSEKNALSFTTTEILDSNPFRLDYFGPIEGAVRPLLKCQNVKI